MRVGTRAHGVIARSFKGYFGGKCWVMLTGLDVRWGLLGGGLGGGG